MIGTLLQNRYQIVDFLGKGGQGHTYLAIDKQRPGNPQCVVKHLKPYINDPKFLETSKRLFQTEAEILASVIKHRQIPQLFAYFEQDQEFYLVEELIVGQDLTKEIIPGQKRNEAYALNLLRSLLPVLEFLHQKGVIHRDIKPPNIIRRKSDRELVLIDFGAVKQFQSELTRAMSVSIDIGSPGYTPSEQLRGRPKPSSDLYALGMMCVQALTGVHPRKLEEDDETGEIRWLHLTSISPGLGELLSKMIRHNLRERYRSASEVLVELQQLDRQFGNNQLAKGVIDNSAQVSQPAKNNNPEAYISRSPSQSSHSQPAAKNNPPEAYISTPPSQPSHSQPSARNNPPEAYISRSPSQPSHSQPSAKNNNPEAYISTPPSQPSHSQPAAKNNPPEAYISRSPSQSSHSQPAAKNNPPETYISTPPSQPSHSQPAAKNNPPETYISTPPSQPSHSQPAAKNNPPETYISTPPSQPSHSQPAAKNNPPETYISTPPSQPSHSQPSARNNPPETYISTPPSQPSHSQPSARSYDVETDISPPSQPNNSQPSARNNTPETYISTPPSQPSNAQPSVNNYDPVTFVSSPQPQTKKAQPPSRDKDPATFVSSSSAQSFANNYRSPATQSHSVRRQRSFWSKNAKLLSLLGTAILTAGVSWGLVQSGVFKSTLEPVAKKTAQDSKKTSKEQPEKTKAQKSATKKEQPAKPAPQAVLPPVKTPAPKTPPPKPEPLPPSIPQPPSLAEVTPAPNALEIKAKQLLAKAEQLAKKGNYKEAIIQADRVPVNSIDYYTNAQSQIEVWSDRLIAKATTAYEQQGKFKEAIAMLGAIPVSVSAVSKAQELSVQWEQEWKSNQEYLLKATKAIGQNKKQEAIAALNQLKATTPYWNAQKANIEQKIASLSQPEPVASAVNSSPPEVSSPVQQKPAQQAEQKPEQKPAQQAEQKPAQQAEQKPAQQAEQKPAQQPAPIQTATLSPDACKTGYVWREATPNDRICVTPQVRERTAFDNSKAQERRNDSAYDPETCIDGYVWREAVPGDRVCVTPQVRAQAVADNSQARIRKAQQ
jgi:serine/threonine protein kinase